MADLRVILPNLFTEIAILEHLIRTRAERLLPDGLSAGHFGILNFFRRNNGEPVSIGNLAWAFQEEQGYTLSKAERLAELGYTKIVKGITPSDTTVAVTDAGARAVADHMARLAPDFRELVSEIPAEDLEHANRVLHEMRLIFDNLPDR